MTTTRRALLGFFAGLPFALRSMASDPSSSRPGLARFKPELITTPSDALAFEMTSFDATGFTITARNAEDMRATGQWISLEEARKKYNP